MHEEQNNVLDMGVSRHVPSALLTEWPDGQAVRSQLFEIFEKETGRTLSVPTPTKQEETEVVAWFNKNRDGFLDYSLRKRSTLVRAYSLSLSAKVSGIAQFNCPICATKDGLYPISVIPIRIPPVSKQAISQHPKRLAAFERAIRHRLKDTNPLPPDRSICLLIVFVVRAKGKQKDLDNMAKAIIDAIKTVLFGDDRQIDHLNIIRIKSPDEEYVYLNIRQTLLNTHDDVLVPRMLHSWAGAEPLALEDFMKLDNQS